MNNCVLNFKRRGVKVLCGMWIADCGVKIPNSAFRAKHPAGINLNLIRRGVKVFFRSKFKFIERRET
jgi:hypothetical protein